MNNLMSLKRKRKRKEEYYKYKHSVCSDAGEKDKSVKSDQWSIGTTVTVDDLY